MALTAPHSGKTAVAALAARCVAKTGEYDGREGTTFEGEDEGCAVLPTEASGSGLEIFRRTASTTPAVWLAPTSGPLDARDGTLSGRRGGPRSHRHHGLESLEGSHEGHSWAM